MDSFFSKGFKGSKCKTLLKLTIPRIKLLRNRREVQLKQMRRDIAKLLETGQEATARIRVEHIIREEKMMAAQEILELFCELIVVRLPIIESQKECPLDLKEAISSLCFAAPRCADLPELLQCQMLFATKYGKEFVTKATDLLPECGVNRQLIELLSVRAPAPDKKLKLLKEIAEEHELNWDPSASENEFLKPHEDLLNGPSNFVSGSQVLLPKEKHEESLHATSEETSGQHSDSDVDLDPWEFPEVPTQPLKSSTEDVSGPEMLPFPASALSEPDDELVKPTATEGLQEEIYLNPEKLLEKSVTEDREPPKTSAEEKQFVPFISPPSHSSTTSGKQRIPLPPIISGTRSETNVDLQDVLAAAQAAAETAEQAAAAAHTAASLAKLRINELVKRNNEVSDSSVENPFHVDAEKSNTPEKIGVDHQSSFDDFHAVSGTHSSLHDSEIHLSPQMLHVPSFGDSKLEHDSFGVNSYVPGQSASNHQFQRLPSMNDEYSYPNLFSSEGSRSGSRANSFADNTRFTHE